MICQFRSRTGTYLEYLMSDRLPVSAEKIALRALTMESLHEKFQSLSKWEQDILDRSHNEGR